MNEKANEARQMTQEAIATTLQLEDNVDGSSVLTQKIANGQLRQMERELLQEHNEEIHKHRTVHDNILQTCMENEDQENVERNIQQERHCGLTALAMNLSKLQTMDRQEYRQTTSSAKSTDEIIEFFKDPSPPIELASEKVVNERRKPIERGGKLSDDYVLARQRRRNPLTKIFSATHVNELDAQKFPCIIPTHTYKLNQSSKYKRSKADSGTAANPIPSAFAIRGINCVGDDDIYDNTIYSQPFASSNELFAENIGDKELSARYNLRVKEEMRERKKAEATASTKNRPPPPAPTTTTYTAAVFWLVFFSTIIGLCLGFILTMFRPKTLSDATATPPSPPSFPSVPSDFDYLQNKFWPISGDSIFNFSSAPYMALEWLVNDDHLFLDVKNVEMSSLTIRYALSVLYFSTNGSKWKNNTHFLTNLTVCEWQFIDCNVSGSIVEIDMGNNNLNGTIPSELAVISSLENIVFYGNHLGGTIPDALANFSRLELLDVSGNYLTGSVPNSFSHLVNLESLGLGWNMLTGKIPQGLANITKLEALAMNNNFFSGTIPSFTQKELQVIWLSNNELDGSIPDSIMTLENLEYLDLTNNRFTGTISSEINGMTNLLFLHLDDNFLSGTMPTTIGELKYLEDLWLSGNNFNGSIPSEFGQLMEVMFIDFDDNLLTGNIPSQLGLLSNLVMFAIHGNSITGTLPLSFSKLTNLESFDITNTSISGNLDVLFCDSSNDNTIIDLEADCGGSFPNVNCTCCTKCCDDFSGDCEMSMSQSCQNFMARVERMSNKAVCKCTDNYSSVSCDYLEECQTCNENKTICGTSEQFGWGFNNRTLTNIFTYEMGRNDTIQWQESRDESGFLCSVDLNGDKCDICKFSACDDFFFGFFIDCTNIVTGDSGLYDSCSPYEAGGVFDVFSWMDFQSWTGCPLIAFPP